MGQSDEGLRFRAAGTAVARAVGGGAAAHTQSEARDRVESGDGTVFGVGGPKGMTALRAVSSDRGKGLGLCGARSATVAGHGSPSSSTFLLFYGGSPPKFANLEKKGARSIPGGSGSWRGRRWTTSARRPRSP